MAVEPANLVGVVKGKYTSPNSLSSMPSGREGEIIPSELDWPVQTTVQERRGREALLYVTPSKRATIL